MNFNFSARSTYSISVDLDYGTTPLLALTNGCNYGVAVESHHNQEDLQIKCNSHRMAY